ncbi:nuclear transport factor 2 family protein [Hymenobacter sp. YC55]|uniref:nuclear transport factor 2 family protein n=1 Tax=Hymenobacter sp. YC55 TaxID=3034019 RepID=UPI0023FA218D|nr:nuclear transport factor 2 family protein [Hymenobacter sp. YC55]MDF7813912.1 nuclear transport factor 2 family protein [Hymenobacter sp. YC55]
MKPFLTTLAFLLGLALLGTAQPMPGTASVVEEQTFTALLTQVATASQKQDTAALSRLFASEYRHNAPDNQVVNRKSELAYIGSKNWPFTTVALGSPVTVNVYGPTAVTVANLKLGNQSNNGPAFTTTLQMLAVWVQRDGRWQIAVLHSKKLPTSKPTKS